MKVDIFGSLEIVRVQRPKVSVNRTRLLETEAEIARASKRQRASDSWRQLEVEAKVAKE